MQVLMMVQAKRERINQTAVCIPNHFLRMDPAWDQLPLLFNVDGERDQCFRSLCDVNVPKTDEECEARLEVPGSARKMTAIAKQVLISYFTYRKEMNLT